jgi:hypothetical protein
MKYKYSLIRYFSLYAPLHVRRKIYNPPPPGTTGAGAADVRTVAGMHLDGGGGDSTRTRANDRPGEYSHYIRTIYAKEVRMRISGYLYDVTTINQTSRFIVSVRIGHWRYFTQYYKMHLSCRL